MRNNNSTIFLNPLVIIFGTLFILLVPFLMWSKDAYLEQISHATGSVIASAKTQSIQTAIDGVITEVLVHEGEQVRKDQELVLLNKQQNQAAFEAINGKVAALKAALTRLKSEVYGVALKFPDELKDYSEFVSTQTELYHRRKKALNDDIFALNESLSLTQSELNLNLPLLKTGDIGATEIIKLKKQIADMKGQITNKQNRYFQEAQVELTKIEEDLSIKLQELEDKKVNLEHSVIYAPMDAIVKNIIITTKGAKVRPGDVILELVPSSDKLIVEAKFHPRDLSFIQIGQKAAVKLDAYDYSIYGIFHGIVKYISPDALIEKTQKGEEFYFRVQIELDTKELITKNGRKIEISPGMTANIDIVTGERTVFDYLAKPIVKTMSESFQER
ncbi:MAG: HlyD family efflux transporter periplasmic adaptor subunit [Aliarcobacter sp.]|jgi:multidrug efflux pump subunit AcrA (membrane-fusion protein)|nr:HlyD family efflux transporter periplasmic adaptor subunit [Aliarcobacter sp.]